MANPRYTVPKIMCKERMNFCYLSCHWPKYELPYLSPWINFLMQTDTKNITPNCWKRVFSQDFSFSLGPPYFVSKGEVGTRIGRAQLPRIDSADFFQFWWPDSGLFQLSLGCWDILRWKPLILQSNMIMSMCVSGKKFPRGQHNWILRLTEGPFQDFGGGIWNKIS